MHLGTLGTILLLTLRGLAQQVSIISPTPNTKIVAGQPFPVTVQFSGESFVCSTPNIRLHVFTADTITSVDVLTLFFGAKANDPSNDLGEAKLAVINAPNFGSRLQLTVELTFPTDLFNGLNSPYNLTCGEFFTVGVRQFF